GKYVGLSPVVNYIHCPKEYEEISVYDSSGKVPYSQADYVILREHRYFPKS
ncbi:hypothetical protein GYMLUDRAFT_171100, partial [Collybiopsis luxurians FD-317 M1]